jgi:energy-coupling factor transporter ATP-binding protein EcfA2
MLAPMATRTPKRQPRKAAELPTKAPVDVLASAVQAAGLGEDVRTALVQALASQLVEDHYAKLEQAGDTEHDGIPLRRVFVDLTTSENPHREVEANAKGFVHELLAKKPMRMCLEPVREERPRGRRKSAGFVLIGGPGQGKSTLGQLACQAHRTALLEPYERIATERERNALRDFTRAPAAKKEFGAPNEPSLPIRIVLPDAAGWLAAEQRRGSKVPEDSEREGLLRYWCSRLPDSSKQALRPSTLLTLLAQMPLLLVLDGLDEVPAAGARERVLSAVRDLGVTLASARARAVIVATTRPQGYAGELDGLGIPLETRYLVSLSEERALTYAERLAHARIADESERKKVIERMREASREPATRRLLSTPLQVTIMVTLLRKGGRPPRERWNLFQRYYEVIYDRELTKQTEAADLLREHKTHVDLIHARAALLLQVESEYAERTEALFTRERLEAVADAVLNEAGFEGDTRRDLVAKILRAAEQRLVFLVEPRPGKFGFEIRSLQEFKAAKALAGKSEQDTLNRLLHIAKSGSFRNVTLFLSSKLIVDGGDPREKLASEICPALERDPHDPLAKAVAAGSVLALDILEEGAALSHPRCAADLMRIAVSLLDLPPNVHQPRLARLVLGSPSSVHEKIEPLLRDALQTRLSHKDVQDRLGAWMALLTLAENDSPWALPMAESAWRKDGETRRAVVEAASSAELNSRSGGVLGPWLVERMGEFLGDIPWQRATSLARTRDWFETRSVGRSAPIWALMSHLRRPYRSQIPVRVGETRVALLAIHSIAETTAWEEVLRHVPKTPAWRAIRAVALFAGNPTRSTLVEGLQLIAESASGDELSRLAGLAPWPLASLLRLASSTEALSAFARWADEGHWGDIALWQAAEERWQKGVAFEHVIKSIVTSEDRPWNKDALMRAPPPGAYLFGLMSYSAITHLRHLLMPELGKENSEILRSLPPMMASLPEHVLFSAFSLTLPSTAILRQILLNLSYCSASMLATIVQRAEHVGEILDEWGRARPEVVRFQHHGLIEETVPITLSELYSQNPSRHGLLYFIGRIRGFGLVDVIPDALLARSRFDNPRLRIDAALVRLHQGTFMPVDVPPLLSDLKETNTSESDDRDHLLRVLADIRVHPSVRETVLAALLGWSNTNPDLIAILQNAMFAVQARTSGLGDPDTWNRLHLPLPLPGDQGAQQARQSAWSDAPIHLQTLVLQNIRSASLVTLEFDKPTDEQGQWIVILGENGTGKSTILRSFVLALRNVQDPQIWPKGTFAAPWRRLGADPDTGHCRIMLRLANGDEFQTEVRQNGKEVFLQTPHRRPDPPSPFLLWAYGCRRGSALGGASPAVDVGEDDGPDVATLFDEGASLIHAETWLQNLDAMAHRDNSGRTRSIFDTVITTLKAILDVTEIAFDDTGGESKVVVTGERVGTRIPLNALSDGYLTSMGWLLDLLARWIARARQAGIEIASDFTRQMTGLVLLDEIDLHLHPAWQLKVIPRVRKLFPRLSFIVTTHNPLTIVGARPEEIWILSRDEQGIRAERRTDIPALLTSAQIFNRFFGIEGFFPNDLGQKLQRYGFLAGYSARSDAEQRELEDLRAALHEKGIVPGWEEVPRKEEVAKPRSRRSKTS